MKTLKVGIASPQEMKARTMAIARGELKPGPDDPKVWFTSAQSFMKLLSNQNRSLLETIATTRPQSLQALAVATGRQAPNLSRTLHSMARRGLVELHRTTDGRLRPEVGYGSIDVVLPIVVPAGLSKSVASPNKGRRPRPQA